jgi:hypothetical protein
VNERVTTPEEIRALLHDFLDKQLNTRDFCSQFITALYDLPPDAVRGEAKDALWMLLEATGYYYGPYDRDEKLEEPWTSDDDVMAATRRAERELGGRSEP